MEILETNNRLVGKSIIRMSHEYLEDMLGLPESVHIVDVFTEPNRDIITLKLNGPIDNKFTPIHAQGATRTEISIKTLKEN